MSTQKSEICNFFQDQIVFITGGSGFVGKVLIEKLLRECHDLRKIYVLLRQKKNKTSEQRFQELFDFPCFNRLKSQNANALSKVFLVNGDCRKPLLGITDHDLNILKKETTCVIHAAASVKFNQTLKEATYIVRATKDLLELATQMSSLKVFVYVSSAYCHFPCPHTEEKFHKTPLKAETLIDMVDSIDDKVLEIITPTLCENWPNTYLFTKAISESLIERFGNILPLVLVRPGVVCNSYEEPMPGWIDNYYGIVGVIALGYLGVIRSIYAVPTVNVYVVPVDYVSNNILAAAWMRHKSTTTTIYNYIGHQKNLITFEHIYQYGKYVFKKFPSEKRLWYTHGTTTQNKFWHNARVFFQQTLIAYITDFFFACIGKPIRIVPKCRKVNEMMNAFSSFATTVPSFDNENVQKLWNVMNDEDKKMFWFDMENFDWVSYGKTSFSGGRLYLLNESMDVTSKARRKLKLLFIAHYSVVIIFYYFLYKLVYFVICQFWN